MPAEFMRFGGYEEIRKTPTMKMYELTMHCITMTLAFSRTRVTVLNVCHAH